MSAVLDPRTKALGKEAMNIVLPELIELLGADEALVVSHIQTAGLAIAATLAVVLDSPEVVKQLLEEHSA